MQSAETLQRLIDAAPVHPDHDWLEVACGPGIISRALAPLVRHVHGVDLTEAMVAVARREALTRSTTNATFSVADATRLPFKAASFDGAVTRFSLHHIPRPGRVVLEMARVVRPGGWLVLADHTTSYDLDGALFHQEIERLRDPSHWACLTPPQLRRLCYQAGLQYHAEWQIPFTLDYEEWLTRGSGGLAARDIIARAIAERPDQSDSFSITCDRDGSTTLHLNYWLSVWKRV